MITMEKTKLYNFFLGTLEASLFILENVLWQRERKLLFMPNCNGKLDSGHNVLELNCELG